MSQPAQRGEPGRALRVAVVGATGAVGSELLDLLGQRRFPVAELRAFATPDSAGEELDFRDDTVLVEAFDPAAAAACDLIFCAAPRVAESLRAAVADGGAILLDLSGGLELEPDVPLWWPSGGVIDGSARVFAFPRGPIAAMALALAPLAERAELRSVSAVALESAAGAGRRGLDEFLEHTVELLGEMAGEAGPSEVFPTSLAFDCVPLVGERPAGESGAPEETRGADVLRRLLGRDDLPLELTRIRVPVFSGSLSVLHVATAQPLSPKEAVELWARAPGVSLARAEQLPTTREGLGRDEVVIGRVRAADRAAAPGLSFVVACDDLRRGAALAALEAAEALLT